MSRIASFDWPDAWPELFTLLIEALHSMNPNVIHGGMRVFAGKMFSLHIKLFRYIYIYTLKSITLYSRTFLVTFFFEGHR